MVPLLVYPLLGTSRHLSVGPVALDMLIVAAAFSIIGEVSAAEYVAIAMFITMTVGLLQIAMGSMRLGFVFNFFSRPVISGFTIAAPIIIAFSQMGNLLGIKIPNTQYFFLVIEGMIKNVSEVHYATLLVGGISIVILAVSKYIKPRFPCSVLLVAAGIVISWIWDFGTKGIELVGNIPSGLPGFEIPGVELSRIRQLFPTILTLALVQFMNVASLGRAFGKRHDYSINANYELIAIGSANFFGSFFQSLPVSGSFSRSAAAEQAGASSAMINVITAAFIIITLLMLTPLFYYLPIPILAAIIIVSAFSLIEIEEVKFLFRAKRSEGWVSIFTAASTLLIGIQEGILLGVLASMVVILYSLSRPKVAELGLIPGTRSFKNIERNLESVRIEDIIILRVDAAFSFVNAEFFRDFILEKSRQRNDSNQTQYVIIEGSAINDLDVTAVDSLKSVIKVLKEWNIELYIAGLKGHVRDMAARSGLKEYLGEHRFCRSPHQAVMEILKKMDEKKEKGRADRLDQYKEKSG